MDKEREKEKEMDFRRIMPLIFINIFYKILPILKYIVVIFMFTCI